MDLISALNWRYATKAFDKDKKISNNDLEEILEAFRLSASAFGIQPWKLVIVENTQKRQELLPHSWNQSQITDASHLLILTRINNIGDDLVNKYLDKIVAVRGVSRQDLTGYENMMKGALNSMDENTRNIWSNNQVYIALGNLLTFLAFKKIDSCPIEGLDRNKYDEILGLKELGLSTVTALPIGYRSENDKYINAKKVRFDKDDLIIKI